MTCAVKILFENNREANKENESPNRELVRKSIKSYNFKMIKTPRLGAMLLCSPFVIFFIIYQ